MDVFIHKNPSADPINNLHKLYKLHKNIKYDRFNQGSHKGVGGEPPQMWGASREAQTSWGLKNSCMLGWLLCIYDDITL